MSYRQNIFQACITLLLTLCVALPTLHAQTNPNTPTVITPSALQAGDKVILISPSHTTNPEQVQFAKERLQALGLDVQLPESLLEQYGHFAGTPESRAREFNAAIKNPDIKALITVRGGSGAGNLLTLLDYDAIKKHPKIILGYSDVSVLLLAIHSQTHLVTFHGPTAGKPLPEFSANYLKAILFEDKVPLVMANPVTFDVKKDIIQTEHRTHRLYPGRAQGKLVGGNLTSITSLLGTKYLPKDWTETILFLEDVDEEMYRIDVMLGQLKNAGILSQIKGFIFGTCVDCLETAPHSFRLEQILKRYLEPLKIPAYYGAAIGHQPEQFTLPIGALVEMNADAGTITLLQSAVSRKHELAVSLPHAKQKPGMAS